MILAQVLNAPEKFTFRVTGDKIYFGDCKTGNLQIILYEKKFYGIEESITLKEGNNKFVIFHRQDGQGSSSAYAKQLNADFEGQIVEMIKKGNPATMQVVYNV